jgi:hypothetical protein
MVEPLLSKNVVNILFTEDINNLVERLILSKIGLTYLNTQELLFTSKFISLIVGTVKPF